VTYAKPELVVLGNAIVVIRESVSNKIIQLVVESVRVKRQTAAYELDE
jgi:5-formaminoimidazole-4-carboxamide-1-beta-D-ribofuranosyl 5'-monophosphate synthetase